MDRYKCRFCFKSFINGRALGGHMRSHMLNLSSKRDLLDLSIDEEDEDERPSQLTEYEDTESDSSDEEAVEEAEEEEEEEDNPKRNRVVDDDEEDEIESETESFPTRRRSKRTRKLGSFDFDVKTTSRQPGESVTELEHHSSAASDTTTEEDLAFCLIMLSRDKWKKNTEDYETEHEEEEEDYKSRKNLGRGRFKCETCGKVFKSYQALGGHRASHKKNKIIKTTTKTEQEEKTEYVNGVKKRIHECPVCFRVFSSGQALGGHKRSHGSIINSNNNLSVNRIQKDDDEVLLSVKQRMIDLNLPAPNEEEDETISVVFDER